MYTRFTLPENSTTDQIEKFWMEEEDFLAEEEDRKAQELMDENENCHLGDWEYNN